MKRPSFQFYPGDWKSNSKLRRCSEAARGAWIDILCLLHDSDEYGVCRWPLDELARASGVPLKLAKELASKDVLKGADAGSKPYIYTPKHAGKEGDPVVLVAESEGPCWYCSRFVRDEYIRQKRGQSTQFSSENQPPKPTPNSTPKGGIGERQGDGPSSSSSSSLKPLPNPNGLGVGNDAPDLFGEQGKKLEDSPQPRKVPDCPHQKIIDLFHEVFPMATRVRVWNETRQTHLRTRWAEKPVRQNLDWWQKFFEFILTSDFLTSKTPTQPGKRPFVLSLDWLVKAENMAKVIEGKYHQ